MSLFEKQIYDLFETIPVGLYQTTMDGSIRYANNACLDIARCPYSERDAWFAQDVRESYLNPTDGKLLREILLRDGKVTAFEAQFRAWDNTIRWLSNSAFLICNEEGEKLIYGSFVDITEKKELEKTLKSQEQFMRNIFDSFKANMAVLNENGVVLDVNSHWKDFVCRCEGENESCCGIGTSFFHYNFLLNSDDPVIVEKICEGIRAVQKRVLPLFEIEYLCRSVNERRWFLLTVTPLKHKPGHTVIFHQDITNQKLIEQSLYESEKRLSLAVSTARIGYWRWNIETNFVEWFGDHECLFGIKNSEFGGTIDHVQAMVHPEDREKGMANLLKTLKEGIPFDNTYRVVHPDGSIRWLNSFGPLSRNEQGHPDYIFGITRDITEFKDAEIRLSEHVKKLEEKNIALNALMDNREEQKRILSETILKNFQRLVFPYFERLRTSYDKDSFLTLLEIIEANVKESLWSIGKEVSLAYRNLSPTEIQVADLIKAGYQSKQIAQIINISLRTVFFYRDSIRKKLNIKNEKENLRSFLLSLE